MSDDKTGETAQEALDHIVSGVKRFREEVYPQQRELFEKLAYEQKPRAMFITCADSRIIPELITQSSPGDLFVTRNVGNVVPPYGQMNGGVSTAIEFAVMALGVQHIIVCGRSSPRCWRSNCGCADHNTLGILTEENVVAQLDHLRTHPSVAARLASGQLFIHGWIYNIGTSEIRAYDAEKGEFRMIGDGPLPMATPRARYQAS